MPDSDWVRLNTRWHEANNEKAINPWSRSQRHFNQALMIHLAHRQGLLGDGPWLDYASGQGGLSRQLHERFGLVLRSFDQFIEPTSLPIRASELVERGYDLVTNTAMFEHARDRATLDKIESYVGGDGCLGLHTLVRGSIPQDPDWMYLLPVHCAFFTNQSMALLMQQWGYTCSVYNEHAKMWLWFKSEPGTIAEQASALNRSMGWDYLHYKPGFMDFWP
jgi:hypothetical protein